MAHIHRFVRLLSVVLVLAIISVLAIQAYATRLDTLPPVLMTIRNYTHYNSILVDLHSRTQLSYTAPPDGRINSPDGMYWARGDYNETQLDIYVARYPYDLAHLGTYDALAMSPRMIWSRESDGFYFLRLEITDDQQQIVVMYVDLATGIAREHGRIDSYNVPRFMWFTSNEHLMLAGLARTDVYNITTGEGFNLPVSQHYIFNSDDHEHYIAYATIDNTAQYTKLDSLNFLRLSDFQLVTILASQFPSPPLISTDDTFAWSSDKTLFAIQLASSGIALINPDDGTMDLLQTNMRLQGGFSFDDAWLLGIEESRNRVDAEIIAYNITTDERIALLAGKQPFVIRHKILWSAEANHVMIYTTEAFDAWTDINDVPIRIYDIPSQALLYDNAITLADTLGRIFVAWDSEWFVTRDYEQFCNTARQNC